MNNDVRLALEYAEYKNSQGLLIASDDPRSEDIFDNQLPEYWEDGDPETVYSIVSLYGNGDEQLEDEIAKALKEKYPKFF